MIKPSKLYYKTCREQAGLTQEQAVVLLGISDAATLSRYENGHTPVSQDLAASMVKVYKMPTLAWWHIIYSNPDLATYLPEPPALITDGDVMFRLEYALDEIELLRGGLKSIFHDGKVDCDEAERLKHKGKTLRAMASKLMEIAGYLEERESDTA